MEQYKVIAVRVFDGFVVDSVVVDDYGEACELCVNWQDFYDDQFYDEKDEVVVYLEDSLERSLLDG